MQIRSGNCTDWEIMVIMDGWTEEEWGETGRMGRDGNRRMIDGVVDDGIGWMDGWMGVK